MILADVALVGAGVLLGRWIMRSVRARRARAALGGAEQAQASAAVLLPGVPCKVGDVLVRTAEHDEAWLAGALVFSEERPVAALFIAPEAGGDRAVFARAVPGAELVWLEPLAAAGVPSTTEPPSTLEHAGVRYERIRRLPVHVSRAGSGAPDVGPTAIVAEYAGVAGDRLLVVAGSERRLAWAGAVLREGEFDVLPGDGTT